MQPQQQYQQPQQYLPGQNQQNIPNHQYFQPVYVMHSPMNYHLNPQFMIPQHSDFPPPTSHQYMSGYHMQNQHEAPTFQDQKGLNLFKAKKSVQRISKCQVLSGYILIIFNAISALSNFFFLFSINTWNKFQIIDHSGKMHTIRLDKFGIILLAFFKISIHLVLVKWGFLALKTFRPVVQELKRQEIAGLFNNQVSYQGDISLKKSKGIKLYKKQVIKILIATIALTFISLTYTRTYLIDSADQFLNAYYQNQTQSFRYYIPVSAPANSYSGYSYQNQNFTNQSVQSPLPQKQIVVNASQFTPELQHNGINFGPNGTYPRIQSTQSSGIASPSNLHNNGKNHLNGRGYIKSKKDNEIELNFSLDDFDEGQAKDVARFFITSAILVIFILSMCLICCIGACCLIAINNAKMSQKMCESQIINQNRSGHRSNIQVATEVSQGNVGQQYQSSGNVNGFQQLPNADDSQLNDSAIIPRGVVVNSIN
eukprot:403352084